MSIVQYQSEVDSGSVHKVTLFIVMIPTLSELLYKNYPRMEEIIFFFQTTNTNFSSND